MLAYPISEAETLLNSKLYVAQSSLANCEEDLDFLREQITVSEVYDGGGARMRQILIDNTDDGSRHCTSVQLGCWTAEKGEY